MSMLLKIVLSFMKIAVLAFGGAYASIPLVEREVVEIQQWMSYQEFADLLALDELTPGPILINSATFVGMKVAGIPGAIAATLGCILPCCLIALVMILIYRKYRKLSMMESVVHSLKCLAIGLILSTFLNMVVRNSWDGRQVSILALILMSVSFIILRRYKPNPLLVMLGCGLIMLVFGLANA